MNRGMNQINQASDMNEMNNTTWVDVCGVDELTPLDGCCALVNGIQVALFMLSDGSVHALSNYDPIGKANVLSRGIIGDLKGEPVIASPLYKQHFSLISGQCLEDETVSIPAYPVRIEDGRVLVAAD